MIKLLRVLLFTKTQMFLQNCIFLVFILICISSSWYAPNGFYSKLIINSNIHKLKRAPALQYIIFRKKIESIHQKDEKNSGSYNSKIAFFVKNFLIIKHLSLFVNGALSSGIASKLHTLIMLNLKWKVDVASKVLNVAKRNKP